MAAFKHSVRDEWLARHLGQEKPRKLAALIGLMTRFVQVRTAGWPVAAPATQAHPKSGMAMVNHDATKTSAEIKKLAQITRR